MQRRLEGSHQGSSIEGRRYGRIENSQGIFLDERGAVSENARRNFIKMCGAQRGTNKVERSA